MSLIVRYLHKWPAFLFTWRSWYIWDLMCLGAANNKDSLSSNVFHLSKTYFSWHLEIFYNPQYVFNSEEAPKTICIGGLTMQFSFNMIICLIACSSCCQVLNRSTDQVSNQLGICLQLSPLSLTAFWDPDSIKIQPFFGCNRRNICGGQ